MTPCSMLPTPLFFRRSFVCFSVDSFARRTTLLPALVSLFFSPPPSDTKRMTASRSSDDGTGQAIRRRREGRVFFFFPFFFFSFSFFSLSMCRLGNYSGITSPKPRRPPFLPSLRTCKIR
ncbi:hypothetical protein LY76DRAFT_194465 [Colletotrichum caudatum]|nr:hypothetical protein LY76DRAFT_194465 [Colletotrichum caudatum]